MMRYLASVGVGGVVRLWDVEMRCEMRKKALDFVQAFSTEQLARNHLAVYDTLRHITPPTVTCAVL